MFRVRTILFPTDFSSYSNQAYLHAVALAEKYRATLFVVYVTTPGQEADHEYWRGQLNTYYDLIVGTDEMLGAAIKTVADAGVLDDTVIVRTADHGELGSAHRLQNKGTTMYDEQNRVPFTIVYPKRFPRGR